MRKWAVIFALAMLLALPALIGVLLYTETGTALVARQLGRLEQFGVHIEGLSGTLSGPLRVQRFELDRPRVHIVSHDIVVQPQLGGLLLQTIRLDSLTARDTVVEIRRAPDLPIVERPARFLPSFMRIDAKSIDFTRVRYVSIGRSVAAERLRGAVRISPRQLQVLSYQVEAERFAARGSAQLQAQRPLALQLQAHVRLRMPRGADAVVDGELRGTVEHLAIKADVLQPSRVAIAAELTRPGSWRVAAHVSSPQFSFEPWLEKPPLSLSDVALNVTLDRDGIRAEGLLGIPEYELSDVTVDARGRFEARVLHLASAEVGIKDAPGALRASGTLRFDGGPPVLALDARWRELQWPLRGDAVVRSPAGEGKLHGSLPYEFELRAEASGAHIPSAKGTARGTVSKQSLALSEYRFDTLDGSIVGAGSLHFAPPRTWTFTSHASALNPAFLRKDLSGRLSFSLSGHGRGLDKSARFAVTLKDLAGTLRGKRVNGNGAVERNAQGWRVRNASAQFGDAELTLDGYGYDTLDARWSLRADSLADFLPGLSGALAFSGSIQGTRAAPHVVLDLRADHLRYQAWRARQLSVEADVNLGADVPSRLLISARHLGHGEPLFDSFTITGSGTAAMHGLEIDALGATSGAQPARAKLAARGSYRDETWNATLTTAQLSNGSRQMQIVSPAGLVLSRERAALDDVCLAMGAGQLCANGKWRRNGPWEGSIAGYDIPLAMVLPQSSAEVEYAGRIEGRVRAFGSPAQPWQAEAGARIIDTAIIYRPPGARPRTLQLGTGGLAATATPQQIDFSFGVQAFTDTFLFVNARLDRDGRNDILHLPLRGSVRGRAGDANILPLAFPDIDHAAGVLTADLGVTGTLAMPELNGRIELVDGELDSYRVNLALRTLNVVANLASNRLSFTGSGRAGDGRLESDGQFAWRDGATYGQFGLKGENLLLSDLAEYRVVASPDLKFLIHGNQLSIAGDVRIPHALIQPVDLSGVVRTSEDTRFLGEHPAEREGRLSVRSEVRVIMGEDVRIDAFGLQGRIAGSVGVASRTGEQPVGRGELAVEEGRYEAYGQKLDIARGRLLFEASPLDDPGLDIEARRKVETVQVGLNVRGTLREPRLTFFSDPSMPQTQIVSYLLVGKPLDQAQSGDRGSVNAARDALALQGGGLLASQLGRRFGLDEIGVESNTGSAGEVTPALVLGKFLSPRLFVSYGISLAESINTLKLRYTISDRWVLKTEAGESQSADVEFTIER